MSLLKPLLVALLLAAPAAASAGDAATDAKPKVKRICQFQASSTSRLGGGRVCRTIKAKPQKPVQAAEQAVEGLPTAATPAPVAQD